MGKLPTYAELIQLVRGVFVITDPGRDQDDEDTLVAANRFIRMQLLEVLGVVANLSPSPLRARLAKGTLNVLGLRDIPVGFGSGNVQMDDDALPYEFKAGYLSSPEEVTDGEELILNTLRRAAPKGVVLVLISTLTDAANVFMKHSRLFVEKVRRVVIMGGVVAEGDVPKLNEQGHLTPDPTAQNHSFDLAATTFLYRGLQEWGIPLTVLSRHAASAVKVPRSMYDNMAATGHPVGIRVCEAQKLAIELLWQRANMEPEDINRKGLPARCNKAWFLKAFCGDEGHDRNGSDSIWDLIQTFMLYDPLTLLAAMPGLREFFFQPYVHEAEGVENLVIGVSPNRHCVSRIEELTAYLSSILVESLAMSLQDSELQTA